jgi:anti-sigma-K factor RskA
MDYANRERADALAAQYVAGTLRGPARRRFEALLPGHPALREAVAAWQERLMPLTGVVPPESPPPEVWQAIESRLWAGTAPAESRSPTVSFWHRLTLWRSTAGVMTVLALVIAVRAGNAPVLPPVVVVLQGTGADAQPGSSIVASLSGDGRALVTRTLSPVSLTNSRVLELWSVPPQGSPRSLGLISSDGLTVLAPGRLPPALLKGGTAALAVSVEPPGGSPVGVPTGPVLFVGKLQL